MDLGGDAQISESVGMRFREAAGTMFLPTAQSDQLAPVLGAGDTHNRWCRACLLLHDCRFMSGLAARWSGKEA